MQAAPGVQEEAVRFSTDFQVACEQIELLGDYKDIHDQLHSLQFHCYNCIVQETKRSIDDDLAWDTLVDYELTFQDIVNHLRDISAQPGANATAEPAPVRIARAMLPAQETIWIQDLVQAHTDLQNAIENADMKQLKRALRLMSRVLTIQPSQVNTRLNTTARALRLPALVQALGNIRNLLALPHLDPEPVHQFEVGVAALADLNSSLNALVAGHDRWQAVDLELRRIETSIDQDLSELDLSWPDLKAMAEPLYAGVAAPWAMAIAGDAGKLEGALAEGESNRIKQTFRRYRRQVGERFYRVDVELKRTCDDLREIVGPLASVLRMLA
jgi:hypothetical protein